MPIQTAADHAQALTVLTSRCAHRYAAFTLEGWVDTMNDVVDSTSVLAIPFFLVLATVAMLAGSLVLAVSARILLVKCIF